MPRLDVSMSGCVIGKTPKGCFSQYLAVLQWLCLYSSKRWQSVLWYKLHKELKGIKDFLVKKQFFLYWIRHRYQSKTYVEHIQLVVDKSLINPTNSSMNLLYLLHMWVIYCQYCKKTYEKVKSRTFYIVWSDLWTCQV